MTNPMADITGKASDRQFSLRARQRRLAQVARILSGEYGQGGAEATKVILDPYGRACTDGKSIWVPVEAVKGNEAMNLIAQEAILAHEAAGHLRYTDFSVWHNLNQDVRRGKADVLMPDMVNILEDTRINHLLSQDFAGSGKRVALTNNHYTNMHKAHWASKTIESDDEKLSAVMTAIMCETISNTPHWFTEESVVACIDDVRPLYQNAVKQPSTTEVIRQAKRVVKKLREHFPIAENTEGSNDSMDSHTENEVQEAADKQSHTGDSAEEVSPVRFDDMKMPSKEDAEEEASEGSIGDSEGEGASTSEEGSEGGSEGESESSERGEGEGELGESELGEALDDYSEEEVDGDQMDTGKDKDGLAGYGGIGSNTIITSNGEMVDMDTIIREAQECVETDDLVSLNDEADFNDELVTAYEGLDAVIGGNDEFGHFMKVTDFYNTIDGRTYRVNGTAANIDLASEHYDNTVSKYEDTISTLVELYERKLAGLDTRWNTQLRRGKLDTRRLSRYGQSRNLFKKRNVQDDPTANVIILVDASGSMGGHSNAVNLNGKSNAHYAANASIIFHEVFHRLGFNCEVVDFSSEYSIGTQGGTQIAVNKLYNTPLSDRSKAAIALPSTGSENSDGRAVNWCYNRLAEMPSDVAANMVFTISDGAPAGPSPSGRSVSEDLKIVAANPPRGVELFALGICGSPVGSYYEHHLSVNDLNEITDKGLHLIEDMLDRVRRNRVVQ